MVNFHHIEEYSPSRKYERQMQVYERYIANARLLGYETSMTEAILATTKMVLGELDDTDRHLKSFAAHSVRLNNITGEQNGHPL